MEKHQYVKVDGSSNLHTTLSTLSTNCTLMAGRTKEVRALRAERNKILTEARGIVKDLVGLTADFDKLFVKPSNKQIAPKAKPKPQAATKLKAKMAPKVKAKPAPVKKATKSNANLKKLKGNLKAVRSSLK